MVAEEGLCIKVSRSYIPCEQEKMTFDFARLSNGPSRFRMSFETVLTSLVRDNYLDEECLTKMTYLSMLVA